MISKVAVRVGLIAGPFVLSAVAWTDPVRPALTCSNATLQGNYGFLVTGTSAGNPIAILGQITADGNGGLTGMETVNDNGAVTDTAPVTGTYKIGSKCVGTATITSQGGTAASYNLAAVSSSKVQLVGADSGTVQSGLLEAQGIGTCSLSGLRNSQHVLRSRQEESYVLQDSGNRRS
jgi:hypothetical protein